MKGVFNCPEYAYHRNYVVASVVNHELWFYGAWDDRQSAYQAAAEINGVVLPNKKLQYSRGLYKMSMFTDVKDKNLTVAELRDHESLPNTYIILLIM